MIAIWMVLALLAVIAATLLFGAARVKEGLAWGLLFVTLATLCAVLGNLALGDIGTAYGILAAMILLAGALLFTSRKRA